MARLIRFFLIIIFGGIVVFSFFHFGKKYVNPTSCFYVNDFAGVLMEGTKSLILGENERMFDLSLEEEDGGTQIVFATFRVENAEEIKNYDKTEIYRQWKIGKNDMGVLVLLFFDDDENRPLETQIEVGYRMEQYLSPSSLGRMIDSSIGNSEYNWLLDAGVINLEYQLLEAIYMNAYQYTSFNYETDSDVYYDYLMDYTSSDTISNDPMTVFTYLLSPFHSSEQILSGLVPYFLLLLYGFGVVKGAGGSSGGMGIFRRR